MLGEESYARARRWDYTIPTLSSELTFFDHPLKSTYIERIVSYIDFLLEFFSVKKMMLLLHLIIMEETLW